MTAGAGINAQLDAISESVQHIEKALFIGNGEPSMKEQLHTVSQWQCDNRDIPAIVRDSKKWIDGVNKVVWLAVSAFVGLFLVTSCGIFFGLCILLYNNGLLKIP